FAAAGRSEQREKLPLRDGAGEIPNAAAFGKHPGNAVKTDAAHGASNISVFQRSHQAGSFSANASQSMVMASTSRATSLGGSLESGISLRAGSFAYSDAWWIRASSVVT